MRFLVRTGPLAALALLLGSEHVRNAAAQGTTKTVSDVQSQLLISDGISSTSSIQVFTNVTNFLELGATATAAVPLTGGATVSSSLLLMNDETKSAVADTQVYYKCTTVPSIWDYTLDPNIDTTAPPEVSFIETNALNTTVLARVALVDCTKSAARVAVGAVVLGNQFFGSSFESNKIHLRVQESSVDTTTGAACVMRLVLTRAALGDVFADCAIKFRTLNATSLFDGSAITSNNQDKTAVQTIVKDPACTHACGVAATQLPSLYSAVMPALSQCYECNTTSASACPETYPYSTATECCRLRNCTTQAVKPKPSALMTWNVAADGVSVLQSEFVLHESGDCSNTASVTSTCCLITCRNCRLALDIESLFFEYVSSAQRTAGDVVLNGNGALNIAVIAPNGCSIARVADKIRIPVTSISTKQWGLTLTLALQLTHQKQLQIAPRVAEAVVASTFRLTRFRGGFVNTAAYANGTLDFPSVARPALASLNMAFLGGLALQVTASVGFLDSAATIGVGVGSAALLKVASSVNATSQFALKPSATLTSSVNTTGDCSRAHFMEFEVSSVVTQAQVIQAAALVDQALDRDVLTNVTALDATKSHASGCVATAYSARFNLSIQQSAVQTIANDSTRKTRLLRALPRALQFTDLDPAMITILSIALDDGTVALDIAVPPSINASFPNATLFAAEASARSKTDWFRRAISTAAAVPANAYCGVNAYGVACDQDCMKQGCSAAHLYCVRAKCDAVTGKIFRCDGCTSTKWGATCDATCLPPATCTAAECVQATGVATQCLGCSRSYWGPTCARTCAGSAKCLDPECNQTTGVSTSCASCKLGAWGKLCDADCALPTNCTSVKCDQTSGSAIICPDCIKGTKGTLCENSSPASARLALSVLALSVLSSALFIS